MALYSSCEIHACSEWTVLSSPPDDIGKGVYPSIGSSTRAEPTQDEGRGEASLLHVISVHHDLSFPDAHQFPTHWPGLNCGLGAVTPDLHC